MVSRKVIMRTIVAAIAASVVGCGDGAIDSSDEIQSPDVGNGLTLHTVLDAGAGVSFEPSARLHAAGIAGDQVLLVLRNPLRLLAIPIDGSRKPEMGSALALDPHEWPSAVQFAPGAPVLVRVTPGDRVVRFDTRTLKLLEPARVDPAAVSVASWQGVLTEARLGRAGGIRLHRGGPGSAAIAELLAETFDRDQRIRELFGATTLEAVDSVLLVASGARDAVFRVRLGGRLDSIPMQRAHAFAMPEDLGRVVRIADSTARWPLLPFIEALSSAPGGRLNVLTSGSVIDRDKRGSGVQLYLASYGPHGEQICPDLPIPGRIASPRVAAIRGDTLVVARQEISRGKAAALRVHMWLLDSSRCRTRRTRN